MKTYQELKAKAEAALEALNECIEIAYEIENQIDGDGTAKRVWIANGLTTARMKIEEAIEATKRAEDDELIPQF